MSRQPLADAEAERPDHPLDVSEVAALVGVDRTTVWSHHRRGTMPPPDGTMGGRPWWWRSTIVAWDVSRRRRGRPKP